MILGSTTFGGSIAGRINWCWRLICLVTFSCTPGSEVVLVTNPVYLHLPPHFWCYHLLPRPTKTATFVKFLEVVECKWKPWTCTSHFEFSTYWVLNILSHPLLPAWMKCHTSRSGFLSSHQKVGWYNSEVQEKLFPVSEILTNRKQDTRTGERSPSPDSPGDDSKICFLPKVSMEKFCVLNQHLCQETYWVSS
jgi:hypothetical protein